MFLSFFKIWVIHILKLLASKFYDFITNLTTKTAIYWNFYLSKFLSLSFKLKLLKPISFYYSLMYKVLVFVLNSHIRLEDFSLTIFLLTTFLFTTPTIFQCSSSVLLLNCKIFHDLIWQVFFLNFLTRLESFLPSYTNDYTFDQVYVQEAR